MPITSTLGSSNRASLAYIEETSFGVTPASTVPNPARFLRFTGESLTQGITKDTSKEIRQDRLTADLIPTNVTANGGVNIEISYGEYDPLIEAVLGGTFLRMGTTGESAVVFTAAINSVGGTITAAVAPTGTDAFTRLVPGQWFRLKAPGDAADGAVLMVASVTTTIITVNAITPIPGTGTRAAVADCKVSSSRVTDGTINRSFTIERAFNDINQFFAYRGMAASKLDLNFDSASLLSGSIDFMGKNGVRAGATTMTGTAVAASQTYDVLNTVTGVGQVLLDGAVLPNTFAKSVKLSIDGKMRALQALGTYGAAAILPGTMSITGTLEIYLADGTIYDRFINNTAAALTFGVRDGSARGMQITLPKIKFSDAKVQAGGLDQDAMLSIPFTALYDPATQHAVLIDTFSV